MSINKASNRGLKNRYLAAVATPWVRPADWLALPAIVAADQKFVGLHAIYTDSNFLALSAAGDYTVDWGDGTTQNFLSGVVAYRTYDYATFDVGNTTLTSRGYKQAIVVVTPQAGQNLTMLNLHQIHNQANLNIYSSGFLDIAIAGSLMTSLLIGSSSVLSPNLYIRFSDLEQAQILSTAITTAGSLFSNCTRLYSVNANTASVIDFNNMFYFCRSLQSIPLLNTAAGTNFGNMFASCVSLQSIPLLNTAAGTSFSSMFTSCSSLQSIPLLNTAAGTNFQAMFGSCSSLQSIPLLNTAANTNFSNMFSSCVSLQSIPLLNTAAGTSFSGMFQTCTSLQSIPLLNTAAGTSFSSMFHTCSSLQSIPLLNTAAGTSFSSMFNSCSSLQSIPLLNTAAGTSFSSMFNSCSSLQSIPLLNTAAGTSFNSMFNTCSSLQSIPLLNTAAGTSFTAMFNTCTSLQTGVTSGPRYALSYYACKLSQTAIESIIANLGTSNTPGLAFIVSGNWGAVAPVGLSGGRIAGSTTVTMASTAGITTGMEVTGTGTPSTTAIAVTMTDAGDTVNLTAHGLSDTDEVSFATIVTTTGIVINKIYFVVSAAANTFQVALTSGGAAIDLITNGSGTLRYKATVTTVNANVSVILSRPATSTGTNTLSFRNLKTNTALLKGWAVTSY